jgi:hypothetical protein
MQKKLPNFAEKARFLLAQSKKGAYNRDNIFPFTGGFNVWHGSL